MTLDQTLKLQEEQARAELEMCYRLTVEEIVEYLQWAQSTGTREGRQSTERLASEVRPHSGRSGG
jgi:hypothetical protein